MSKSGPKDKKLWAKVKSMAKKKFKVFPSAYAGFWMSKKYKKLGGKYSGKKPSKSSGLTRWAAEKWINVCKLPKKVSCGRPKANHSQWKKDYPYCRPSVRVNSSTPKLASQLSKTEIKRRCSEKQKNPRKRVYGKSKRKSPKKKCRSGWVKDRSSGRCRKSKIKSRRKSRRKSKRKSPKKKCRSGWVKDRSSGRCRKSKRKSRRKSPKKKCRSGLVRDRSTGRCRKSKRK